MIGKEEFFNRAVGYQIQGRNGVFHWLHVPNEAGVYAVMDQDECVYIGETKDLRLRMSAHAGGSNGAKGLRERLRAMRLANTGRILFLAEPQPELRLLWEAELQEQIPTTLADKGHTIANLRKIALPKSAKQILLKYMEQKQIHSTSEALEKFFQEAETFLLS